MPGDLNEHKTMNCKIARGVMVEKVVSDLGDLCSSPMHIKSFVRKV